MTLKLQYFQFASGFLIASTKLPYLMFQDLFFCIKGSFSLSSAALL